MKKRGVPGDPSYKQLGPNIYGAVTGTLEVSDFDVKSYNGGANQLIERKFVPAMLQDSYDTHHSLLATAPAHPSL